MSDYLSNFQTEAQYQARQDTLKYPHLSLINETGRVHYLVYPGEDIGTNAAAGDILVENATENYIKLIKREDYSYDWSSPETPIGVCLVSATDSYNGYAMFSSLKFMSYSSPQTGDSGGYSAPAWQNLTSYDVNYGSFAAGWWVSAATQVSGLTKFKEICSRAGYNGYTDGATVDNNSDKIPIYKAVNFFHTSCTKSGDWVLPTLLDINPIQDKWSDVKAGFDALGYAFYYNEYGLLTISGTTDALLKFSFYKNDSQPIAYITTGYSELDQYCQSHTVSGKCWLSTSGYGSIGSTSKSYCNTAAVLFIAPKEL